MNSWLSRPSRRRPMPLRKPKSCSPSGPLKRLRLVNELLKPPEPSRPERKRAGRESPELTKQEPSTPVTPRSILPGPWPANVLAFLLFVVATLVLYSSDLRLGFFSVDDPGYVVNNPWIRSFSAKNLGHILSAPYFANYSPVHLLSYTLDYAFAGPSAPAFHLSSNLWAGLVAGSVFLVALALTGRRPVALAAAALFVAHPAHVEA